MADITFVLTRIQIAWKQITIKAWLKIKRWCHMALVTMVFEEIVWQAQTGWCALIQILTPAKYFQTKCYF